MTRRVVVTGVGMVSPLGHTVDESWEAIKAGKSGIGHITRYDATTHNVKIAGEIRNWDATQYVSERDLRRHDRYQIFAFAAAKQVIEQIGFKITEEQRGAPAS